MNKNKYNYILKLLFNNIMVLLIYFYSFDALAAEKRIALVIGNANYGHDADLKNPINDATDMSAALKRLGFVTYTVLDGNQSDILVEIDKFKKNIQTADIALFFYAGHGIQHDSRNYLIPKNFVLNSVADLKKQAIDASKIVQVMGNAKSKVNIIVLDACRNNPLTRGLMRQTLIKNSDEGLAPMESISGSLISFSTQPGNTASDGSGSNGLYTEHLLRFIEKPKLDIVQMFNAVSLSVQKEDQTQQPWIHFSAIPPICLAKCESVNNLSSTTAMQESKNETPKMQSIIAGSFLMGDAQEIGDADERPAHEEQVNEFFIGKFEVTVDQFKQFVEATNYLTDSEKQGGCWEWTGQLPWRKNLQANWKSPGFSQRGDSPVVCISWEDANQYVRWLSKKTGVNYRLPTEVEWEYTARAGSTTPFLYGNSIGKNVAHCATCPGSQYGNGPAPVGSFKSNSWELHDMQGNVWEWTADSYVTYDGQERKPNRQVVRGGSWTDIPDTLRLSGRIHFSKNQAMTNLGFRVVHE